MTAISDPWNDVIHQVSVDPVDNAGIDISDLEQRWNLWVSGSAIDPDHISHPPVLAVLHDHGHPRTNVEKHRVRLWCCDTARMASRHSF